MKTYKGFKDYYDEDFKIRKSIRDRISKLWANYGYNQYESPTVELKALYEMKSSSELVDKQSYSLKGDKELILRPEATPSVARYISANKSFLSLPLRLYSIMPMFRKENPQKGRLREFYQYNLDFAYQNREQALIENLDIINETFKILNINNYEIRLNNREWVEWIIEYFQLGDSRDILSKLDKEIYINDIFDEISKLNNIEDLVIYLKKNKFCEKKIQKILKYKNIFLENNVVFSLKTVRGLDYYKGFVFEVFYKDSEKMARALGGGGEYDLVSKIQKEGVSMMGFALGEVPILEVIDLELESKEFILLCSDDIEEDLDFIIKIRKDYITNNKRIIFIDKNLRIKKALSIANKMGATFLIYRGDRERLDNKYLVKNLKNRTQEIIIYKG